MTSRRTAFMMDCKTLKVYQTLRSLYGEVWILVDWLRSISASGGDNLFLTDDDSDRYRNFLHTTVVCRPKGVKNRCVKEHLETTPTMMRDLLHTVIERLLVGRRGRISNVLTLGFGMVSENSVMFSCHNNLELQHLNSNFSELNRPHWQDLLNRVGETVMMHMLEKTAMFLFVPPSSYTQITGLPVYELPFDSNPVKLDGTVRSHDQQTNSHSRTKTSVISGEDSRNKTPRPLPKRRKISRRNNQKKKIFEKKPKKGDLNIRFCKKNVALKLDITGPSQITRSENTNKRTTVDNSGSRKRQRTMAVNQVSKKRRPEVSKKMQQQQSTVSLTSANRVPLGGVEAVSITEEQNTEETRSPILATSAPADINLSIDKAVKKRTRRGKRKKSSVACNCINLKNCSKPGRILQLCSLLYGRDLREKWTLKDRLCQTGNVSEDVHCLFLKIFGALMCQSKNEDISVPVVSQANSVPKELLEEESLSIHRQTDEESPRCLEKSEIDVQETTNKNGVYSQRCNKRLDEKGNCGKNKTDMDFSSLEEKTNVNCRKRQVKQIFYMDDEGPSKRCKINEICDSFVLSQKSNIDCNVKTYTQTVSKAAVTTKNVSFGCIHVGGLLKSQEASSSLPSNSDSAFSAAKSSEETIKSSESGVSHKSFFEKGNSIEIEESEALLDKFGIFFGKKTNMFSTGNPLDNGGSTSQVLPGGEVNSTVEETRETTFRNIEKFQCLCLQSVYRKLEPILMSFLEKHRSFPYRHFLNHYCPINKKKVGLKVKAIRGERRVCLKAPVYKRRNGKVTESGNYQRKAPRPRQPSRMKVLLGQYVPQRNIFLFLRQICLRVLSREIIGRRNWNQLLKRIKELLFMNRFDKVNFRNIMMKIKVRSVPWLRGLANQNGCNIILFTFVWWLFTGYIMVILKTYFYVTDSTMFRNKLFFYRKSVWHQLNTMATKEYLENRTLEVMRLNDVKTQLIKGISLGISGLRFLPKSSSLRPITNMGGNSGAAGLNLPFKVLLPINTQLTCVFQVLSYIQSGHPDLAASSVFGVDDIYKKWKEFVSQREMNKDNRELYFVSVDIRNCYDSINQDKLFEIVKDIFDQLRSSEFIIQKYVKVLPCCGEVKKIFKHRVTSLEQFTGNSLKDLGDLIKKEQITDAIIVDQISEQQINEDEILLKLSAHIFKNIIRVGSRFYHQKLGISQGSVLSSILCSLYSNHLEKSIISLKPDELMMRMVDDWIYVTPYPHRAGHFLKIMTQGLPEYNYYINSNKTRTNFSGVDETNQSSDLFPWCGLVLDTKSLSVSIDYSRYAGISISHTLSVDTSKQAGEALKRKMLFSLRPRCHPLYVSKQINTEEVTIMNIYKIFLLLAFKFNAAAKSLLQGPTLNPQFFVGVIVDCAEYFFRQTSQKMKKLDGETAWSEVLTFTSVKWLCLAAFQRKLSIHQATYHTALKILRKLLYQIQSKMTPKEKEVFRYLDNQDMVLQSEEFSAILN